MRFRTSYSITWIVPEPVEMLPLRSGWSPAIRCYRWEYTSNQQVLELLVGEHLHCCNTQAQVSQVGVHQQHTGSGFTGGSTPPTHKLRCYKWEYTSNTQAQMLQVVVHHQHTSSGVIDGSTPPTHKLRCYRREYTTNTQAQVLQVGVHQQHTGLDVTGGSSTPATNRVRCYRW